MKDAAAVKVLTIISLIYLPTMFVAVSAPNFIGFASIKAHI